MLAALGGIAGVFVAAAGVRALVALSPPGLPRAGDIGVDAPMFAVRPRHHDDHRTDAWV